MVYVSHFQRNVSSLVAISTLYPPMQISITRTIQIGRHMPCVATKNASYTRTFYVSAMKTSSRNACHIDRSLTGYTTGQRRIGVKVSASTTSSRRVLYPTRSRQLMFYSTGEQCQRLAITHLCVSPLTQTIKTDGKAKSRYRQAKKCPFPLLDTVILRLNCNYYAILDKFSRKPQIHQFYSLKIAV